MNNQYNLNINTSWHLLPWSKIYARIIILQKKIYKATKEYKFKSVYKLQKYLLNSNEAKIISIKYILSELYIYNKYKKKIKYILSDKDKFTILKNLSISSNNNRFSIIIEQIRQYLIYLCIKPEWEAKFLCYLNTNNNLINNDNSIDSLNKYYSKIVLFNSSIKNQKLFIINILKNIKSLKYIQDNLYYWLCNNYYIKLNNINTNFSIQILQTKYIFINELYSFLIKILTIGSNWYSLYLNKINLFIDKNNILYIFQFYYEYNNHINKNLLIKFKNSKLLFKLIKSILYKNNIFSQLLKYIYLNVPNINIYFINIYWIRQIYPFINLIIFYFLKKNYNNIYFKYKKIKQNNILIRQFFYIKKLEYIYLNFYK
uniref:Reverse transcriptase N-terminal domain-containing protein n=1 Tax=Apoglossum ruscifolium TaxID=167976 RepID=A0A4D6WQP0_9FLOR|nr:hypothetical protein [Apoglossum ruscifolium]